LWPKIKTGNSKNREQRKGIQSFDPPRRRLAEAINIFKRAKERKAQANEVKRKH